jgi:glycerol kinase
LKRRNCQPNSIARGLARAALESVCHQTAALLEAMRRARAADDGARVVRVDGSMVASDWTMQFLADILGAPVDRPTILETTALRAAYLASFRAGPYPAPERFAKNWRHQRRFVPRMPEAEREKRYAGSGDAVWRTLSRR